MEHKTDFMQRVNPIIVEGDLLDQDVEAIVNPWNRNIIPWWLLLPQGVSGAIKRRGGMRPFIEVGRAGPIPLGNAVATSAGRLPFKSIIHVAGINMLWRSSQRSIQDSVRSAMDIVARQNIKSMALPIIGAGSGGRDEDTALNLMLNVFGAIDSAAAVTVVQFRKKTLRHQVLEPISTKPNRSTSISNDLIGSLMKIELHNPPFSRQYCRASTTGSISTMY